MSDSEDSAAPALPLGRVSVIQIRPYGPILFASQTFALQAISSFYFDIAIVGCNGGGPIGWSGLVRMNESAHTGRVSLRTTSAQLYSPEV